MSGLSTTALVAVVEGRVQGVGFRWSTRRAARDCGVVGRVSNLADGRVEVIAEGPEDAMKRFLGWLAEGPSAARVDRLVVDRRVPAHAYDSFEID